MHNQTDNLKTRNILYLVHSYNSFQKDQIDALAKYFNNVYVLVRYKPVAEISRILPISRLKPHQKKNAIQTRNTPSNVTVIPVPLYYMPFKNSYKKLGIKHLDATVKIIKRMRINFDIVHAHFAWTSGYVGMKLKEIYKKPFVLTSHGYDIYNLPFENEFYKNEITSIIKSADVNITVSKSNAESFKKLGFDLEEVEIIPNGYNKSFHPQDMLSARKTLGLPHNKKILISIGNLKPIKGHEYLIKALSQIKASREDWLCLIIGDGPSKRSLSKIISKEGLCNNIKLVGNKPHEEIPKYINASNLLIVPSIQESFGVVQVEAMASGKPVVATINGGSEEIIISEDIGFLCKSKNPEDLAEKIDKAINKEWDPVTISTCSEKYRWDNICEKIAKEYNKL